MGATRIISASSLFAILVVFLSSESAADKKREECAEGDADEAL